MSVINYVFVDPIFISIQSLDILQIFTNIFENICTMRRRRRTDCARISNASDRTKRIITFLFGFETFVVC